jgi:transcription termination factor Rho
MWVLRRILMPMGTVDAIEFLLDKMKDSARPTNDFFDSMNARPRWTWLHRIRTARL